MDLIIETDLGHDPDDFFALCYLYSAGVNIRAIVIAEGDPDQVAIAKFFCKELGLDIPIGVANVNRKKMSSGGVHYDLLDYYGYPHIDNHDGLGSDIIHETLKKYPDSEFFICGPMKSFGNFLIENNDCKINRITIQGGFLAYRLHNYPCPRLPKFEDKDMVPTFNLCGAIKQAEVVIEYPGINERRFVCKNVCHTIIYDKNVHSLILSYPINDRGAEIFNKGMDLYLEKHDSKKFHDPSAAVCHLHPEIADWVMGKLYNKNGKWGTRLDIDGDYIIANISYDKLWEYIGARK